MLTNRTKLMVGVLCATLLSACATPRTMMRNPETKQIVQCGGDRSGSIMLGAIGYSMQASDAADCVKTFSAQGFVVVPDATADGKGVAPAVK